VTDGERRLAAAAVEIAPIDPANPDAQHCLRAYFADLDRRFETGFDPALSVLPDAVEMRPPAGLFLVASLAGEPIGCGGLKFNDHAPADIKRMWVAESARGMGIGRRLLGELEGRAAAHGAHAVRLETNNALAEAINLYRSAGYVEVTPFNDERYAHHWFEKQISRTAH
jgi:ribosomal protein S18 acetylase RimI-like enzyme